MLLNGTRRAATLVVPASGTPVTPLIRCDYVISRGCQRQHDPPPAIRKLREAVQKQDAWSALGLETRLQYVHREPVDVVDNPGADAWRERGIAVGRKAGVISADNGRSRRLECPSSSGKK